MCSNVMYINLQEDFERDRQWLAKEWERRQQKQESADANDSDTMSCSEFGCIDDVREDEDFNQVDTTDSNSEHTETDHSTISVDDFMIDQDICESNEDQSDIIYINFPSDQQDYYSYGITSKIDDTNLENLNFIDNTQKLSSKNCELRGDKIDLKSCLNKEKRSDNHDKKRKDWVDISCTEEERTGEHENPNYCGNELTDDVKSRYRNDVLVNDCFVYKLVNVCDVSYYGNSNKLEDRGAVSQIEGDNTECLQETSDFDNELTDGVKSRYCKDALVNNCLVYELVNGCGVSYHGNKLEDSGFVSQIEEENSEGHQETNDYDNELTDDVTSRYCNDALENDCLAYKLVNGCDVSYHGNKLEDGGALSQIEEENSECHEETNDFNNELTDDVKSRHCNDALENDCLAYKFVDGFDCGDVSYHCNTRYDSGGVSHFKGESTKDHEETNESGNGLSDHVKSRHCNDALLNDCLVYNIINGCDISYHSNKREDNVDISHVEEERTKNHEETSDCANELTDDVKSKHRNNTLVNNYGRDGDRNYIALANNSASFEGQTKYDNPIGQSKDCTEGIKVIVFGEELKSYEEVGLHEKEQPDNVQVSLNVNELTDQGKPKQNDVQENNIKHQTTQTCDILFRDKERSPADMFICEYCHKVFANQYKLDSHRSRNHGCEEKKDTKPKKQPKTSDEWPPNIQKLALRVNGKKHFFCSQCSYSVDRCDSITKHMFRIHNNGRPVPQFQCEICGKMFVDRAYLRNHKVSHMTEKLHNCEVCGRSFHRQPSLKRHLQTHTVDRQYSCTLCDYKTNRKHMMYKHVEYHKLGHAYICHVCDTHLYTQLAYRSHMYKHRVPTNSCSFCKVGFSSKERMMCHMRKVHSAFEINIYKGKPKLDPLE